MNNGRNQKKILSPKVILFGLILSLFFVFWYVSDYVVPGTETKSGKVHNPGKKVIKTIKTREKLSKPEREAPTEEDIFGPEENFSQKNHEEIVPINDHRGEKPVIVNRPPNIQKRIIKEADIPPSQFLFEFNRLSRFLKQKALYNLAKIPDFEHDIASLHVDKTGMIYYACDFKVDPEMELTAVKAANSAPAISYASVPIANPPIRHSKPGATKVLYLDFNGGTVSGTAWNTSYGVASWDCKPYDIDGDDTTFSDNEQTMIIEFWAMVAEDYAPFDVDVTTEAPAAFDRNTGWAMITEGRDKNGVACPHNGYGGIAYVDVFGDADYNTYSPAWVLEYASTYSAEAAAHELGHNIGLSHDGQVPGDGEYYGGHDNGVIFWNAIMGGGTSPDVSQWSKGEYYNATRTQDDLAIIAAKLAYRADDHGDTNGTASALNVTGTTISDSGIIENTDDPDVFSFTTGAGSITINANAYKNTYFAKWGGNLDINLELYNSSGTLVASDNPITDIDASITTTVVAGTYYIHVKPTGVGSPLNSTPTGYTSYGSLGQYTLTGNTSPGISISINDIAVVEGNAGTVNADFTVTLTGGTTFPVTVDYATADNTATVANGDYVSKVGTLTFNADGTQTVSVTVNGDATDEGDESFYVNLSNAVNAPITDSQGEGVISNDDGTVTLSVNTSTIAEASGVATFTATLSTATPSQTVTVDLGFSGTATGSGTDYTASSNQIVISPGATTGTMTVTADQDTLDEDNETVIVDITSVTNALESGAQQKTVSIVDDDDPPTISIDDVSATEVDTAGTSTATFTVSLSAISGKTITVDYTTTDGSATAGVDYTAATGTLTFNPGDSSKNIAVTIIGDFEDENDETFTVDLSNPANATIADAQGIGTIVDDDTTYTVAVKQGTGDGPYVNGVTVTIIAEAPQTGLAFSKWTGPASVTFANENATTTTFIMPEENVSVTATYAVDPATAEKITYGYQLDIYASQVSDMDAEFTKRPTIYGNYTDPVRNTEYISNTKVITKISTKQPANKIQCLWSRSVYLYNRSGLLTANKAGTTTAAWLAGDATQNANLACILFAKAKTAAGITINPACRGTLIVPPTITSIELWDESGAAGGVHTNSVVIIKGTFFGIKPPTVGLEYTDAAGAVRQLRLKVLKPYKYPDYKGSAGKSCMDLTSATGVSEIKVQMPSAWWTGWTAGAYTVVLDNKIGLDAAQTITTIADGGGTAPTANNDTVTLHTGCSSYEIDVLANDTDADSDNMTIIPGGTASTLGGAISVSNGKVKYTPPKGVLPANFPDTFTYSLSDGHGGTSGNATVTVNMNAITLDPLSNWNGTALGASAVQPGSLILITGTNFGIKAPIVTLAVENGVILKLKVQTPPAFADYKGAANKSYTDVDSTSGTFGNSLMLVEMPKVPWAGYGTNSPYTLTVSNAFDTTGATANIATTGTNTAPTANNDAVTITSGSASYLIDVLADNGSGTDTDAESDKLTIVLGSKTSTQWAKLSVDKKTNQVKYSRAAGVACPFADSFTYSLVDPSGATSGAATVTITGALATP